MVTTDKFADCLARLRFWSCYSQSGFAARFGVPLSSYVSWEQGVSLPSFDNLRKILSGFAYTQTAVDLRRAYSADKLRLRRLKRKALRGASGK